ncbi:MAG: endopolygalacturonase, partial [Spirochaetia bacterium]|nr:endopolygalacturonase [Spirochaetia bacterium]
VKNTGPRATYRENLYEIKSVNGNEIGISEPLRLDFPVEDESYVQKIRPVENCGVEDLTLEQTEKIWTSGILFSTGWNCWIKGVAVIKTGRYPFCFPICKYGEVRDSEFHDAWWKGGGGTAYVGFERSYDCLIDGIKTTELRHAPNVNWAPSGCVFRNSTFEGSDGQWHSGWANEILMENLVIHSATNGGGYGFGLFTTAPEDNAHGPIGPRSVVYNCDITSPKDGLILNGMNEGWVVAHNRFRVVKGRGISARLYSFDHIVRGNVFLLENPDLPAIRLANSTCYGWEIEDNLFYGVKSGEAIGGPAKPLFEKNNQVFPFAEAARPTPKVPSIFEWQKVNVKER